MSVSRHKYFYSSSERLLVSSEEKLQSLSVLHESLSLAKTEQGCDHLSELVVAILLFRVSVLALSSMAKSES
jgi:hypothetical protein